MKIFGKNAVNEALIANQTFNKLYVENALKDPISNKIIALAKEKGIRINFVEKTILNNIASNVNHQGFFAEIIDFEYCEIEDMLTKENPFLLILDGIEDPHNFGAIIRTAECAGVDGIIIPKHRACAVNETVVKTSAGAIANMKICMETNLNQAIMQLKDKGFWVYALELGGKPIEKIDFKGKIALVIGSEGFGVTKLVKENCDDVCTLEMHGKTNSLNASVATGIAVYKILEQR